MTEGLDSKICNKCNEQKLFSEFHKHPECKYGRKAKCKNCLKKRDSDYRLTEAYFQSQLRYKSSKKWRDSFQKWKKKKRKEDPLFALNELISSIVKFALNKNKLKKTKRSKEILGCDIDFFKKYLESKFEPWMNWENRGLYNGKENYGWDIDHIIPISQAKTIEEVYKLSHYTNLQPLCSRINRDVKRDKLDFNK